MNHMWLDGIFALLGLIAGIGIGYNTGTIHGFRKGWDAWAKKYRNLADHAEDIWSWKLRIKVTEDLFAEKYHGPNKPLGAEMRAEIAKRVKQKKIEFNKT